MPPERKMSPGFLWRKPHPPHSPTPVNCSLGGVEQRQMNSGLKAFWPNSCPNLRNFIMKLKLSNLRKPRGLVPPQTLLIFVYPGGLPHPDTCFMLKQAMLTLLNQPATSIQIYHMELVNWKSRWWIESMDICNKNSVFTLASTFTVTCVLRSCLWKYGTI